MNDPHPKQHGLRYLFFVTTCVAVGLGLISQNGIHSALGKIGLGLLNYWIAKAFFTASTRLPKVLQEIVFLIGLPFFVGFLYCMFTGSVELFFDLAPRIR